MSNPVAALKAVSHRDALAKTVRLLTRDGIPVHFRGHQPHVKTKGNRAIAMVLPELGNDVSEEMLAAIHGYLDHEFGHICYTPFARATRAGSKSPMCASLINIVEDIRLEKLLPRDYPGAKLNLERMYDTFIPKMIDPATKEMVASGDKGKQLAGVLVPAMRALAGQRPFQQYMDDNAYWPHFMPLLSKMPTLARRLKDMEKFDDVEAIVTEILEALTPPPPPPPPPQPEPEDEADDDQSQPTPSNDADKDDQSDDQEDGDDGDPGDQPDDGEDDDDANAGGGKGHGDGAGADDEEGDDDDTDCSGDGTDDDEPGSDRSDDGDDTPGDEDGDDQGDDDDGSSDGEDDADPQPDEGEDSNMPGAGGNTNVSITDALKQLEPNQRKAIFEYKKNRKTVAQIATDMNLSEDEVGGLLSSARRRLGQIMKGARP